MTNGNSNINHQQNYIITRVGSLNVVFSALIIAEIIIIEAHQILSLPFYQPSIAGCIHYQGKIIPLIALCQMWQIPVNQTRKLSVIRLNENADFLEGVGVIIERILGQKSQSELPPQLFQSLQTQNMRLFQPSLIDTKVWQPQRFYYS